MDDKFRSRKFALAGAFTATGIIALFTGHISGGELLGLAGVVLALYGAANVAEKRSQ